MDIPSAEFVKKFFTNKQWNNLVDVEKKRFINIYENYVKQKELGLEPRLPIFKVNDQNYENSSDSDKDEEWVPQCSNRRKIDKKFLVPKTTKFKRALKSWPEFKPHKEDSESEEEAILSSSQNDIKYLWNSVTLEPDSENNVKIREYFPCSITPTQFSIGDKVSKQELSSPDSVTIEKRRYPKRNSCRKNYNESKISLNNDDYFYCDFCDLDYEGGCPDHPLLLVLDKQSPRDGKNKKRAIATTPWPLFIADSKIIEAGLGVWTYANLPEGLLFGPYEGRVDCDVKPGLESGYGWKIRSNTHLGKCIDALDPTVSNWMRYVNCSRSYRETNLSAFQFKGEIYYKTIREIKRGEELLIWYGDEYGKELGYSLEHTEDEVKIVFFKKAEVEAGTVLPQAKLIMRQSYFSRSRNFDMNLSTIYGGPASDLLNKYIKIANIDSKNLVQRESSVWKFENCDNNNNSLEQNSICEAKKFNDSINSNYNLHNKNSIEENSICEAIKYNNNNNNNNNSIEENFLCNKNSMEENSSEAKKYNNNNSKEENSVCEVKKFNNNNNNNNNNSNNNNNNNVFTCFSGTENNNNDFFLKKKESLLKQIRTHTEKKTFKCSYCDKSFNNKSSLKAHIRIHTGELFKCSYCDKSFNLKRNLERHIRTHTGEKPFKCSYCDESFNRKDCLQTHIRTHTGELFKCSYCDKSFNHKSNLKTHIRTHTGEKPFKCFYCDKSFSQKSHLETCSSRHGKINI